MFVWPGYAVKSIEVGKGYERFLGMGRDRVMVKSLTMDERSVKVEYDEKGVYHISLSALDGWVPLQPPQG